MVTKIEIGSIVYGKGGVGNPVTAIDNDMLTIDTPKGLRMVNISKITRVETPDPDVVRVPIVPSRKRITSFKLGDRVKYIGSDFNLKTQYAGTLEVWDNLRTHSMAIPVSSPTDG